MEKRFMSPFQRIRRRQAGQLGHHADQTYSGHARNERIVFRHIADGVTDFSDLRADVHSKNSSGTFNGMKSQESLNQGALTCAVRTEESDCSPGECPGEVLENWAAVEKDGQVVEFYRRNHLLRSYRKHKETETQRHRGARIQFRDRAPLCLCVSVSLCFRTYLTRL